MSDFVCPEGAVLIPLRNKNHPGRFAIVDADCYSRVVGLIWYYQPIKGAEGYAASFTSNRTHLGMHRFLLDAPKHLYVDHINGNGLDNRLANLRLATAQENAWNAARVQNNASGFKGVRYEPRTKGWLASIYCQGQAISLGVHPTAEQAARVYDAAARHYFGEFARFNFPDEMGLTYTGPLQRKHVDALSKNWRLEDPEGNVFEIKNLSLFCAGRALSPSKLSQVASGVRHHHKGWKCSRVD